VPKVGTSLQHKTKSSIHRIPKGVDSALARRKPPGLPREIRDASGNGLSQLQGRPTASWKSAEGVLGEANEPEGPARIRKRRKTGWPHNHQRPERCPPEWVG
jgi:hypothetical protein